MADKKKLDDLLTQDFARPPIRRGQGVTLSTQQVPDEPVSSPPEADVPPVDAERVDPMHAQTHKRTNAQTHTPARVRARDAAIRSGERTNAQTHKRTNAQTSTDVEQMARVSQGQRLRVDLIRALKQIALDDGRKLYQVMEDAIEEYIERRRQHEQ